ncbi:hypothetical protein C5167_029371 [Papaver somniferum]|uniref:fe(2+) transport protein 1-like n=1 Tax=Papaver somniferum TaxID=3469 RepID=UPI000E6FEFDB|nr:fe(2+) transport protein 1-like [Papaver somniferum]RZC92907.1 hypothetical protein C5167_029371 [Papaver somniferum]
MAPKSIFFILMIISISAELISAQDECQTEESGDCVNKSRAQPLKIIAIVSILVTSMIGVGAPLFVKYIPALHPDRDLFVIVKAFAAGIILATGFMHVLPDSFDMLSSTCLSDNPWHKFPFTGFVAMLSAIVTLMVDSMATSFYTTANNKKMIQPTPEGDHELGSTTEGGGASGGSHIHSHGHYHGGALSNSKGEPIGAQLLRYRVVAMVLELGIVVHSIVIGLGVGASNNTCTIKPLVAALCFHQMFEGMGLGGCIMQVIL